MSAPDAALEPDQLGINPAPTGLAEPTTPVGRGFMARYALAYFGMWVALLTPTSLTLGVRTKQVAPDGAAELLSLVLGVGSALAIVCNPLFGKLSDRTRSRWGMRRPWIIGGAMVGTVGLALVALAPNVPLLVLGWAITQGSYNAVLGALTAVLPDQVPSAQRGRMSGLLGLCGPLGIVTGTFVASRVDQSIVAMFLVPAAIGLVAIFVFGLTLQDRRLHGDHPLPEYRLGEFLRSFWVNPLRHRDFGWAWFSRLFMNWGYATGTTYQVLFLTDGLGFEVSVVAGLTFIATSALQVTAVVFSGFGGWLSDRIGSRKKVVAIAAGFLAAGLGVVAFSGSFETFILGVAIAGVGQGLYVSVELAVVAEVVTDPTTAARDFGVSNIGNTLPQTLVPAIAPIALAVPLLSGGGDNFTALFLLGSLLTLAGAVLILPIKAFR
ncbi:MFS transporter [Brachybacterium sacelli]|uniref:MFS family permease n=1 Tax=Brachybacterium sacelli TaxID=173364 RepID=A0ABS4WYW7_9MICO|nr:MFS transporter [Brachybacterium sacelli]MBP2381402.1 MFS family permease [Brachybacterium sacelli]